MSENATALTDTPFQRAILNLVIPPQPPMPGAGDLDLWPAIAPALNRNPTTAAALEAIRTAALARHPGGLPALTPEDALSLVQSITAGHPTLMPTLNRATALAYYQHPTVLTALGQPPRPPFPEGFSVDHISAEWRSLLQRRAVGKGNPEIPLK